MLKNDIELAQKIVSGSFTNVKTTSFHDSSFVYRFTNEDLTKVYKYLKDKKKILTVTSSGDQILNSILAGAKYIDSFDISIFPKYYFELKKAGIKSLNKEDFEIFFCSDKLEDEIADFYYEQISNNMDQQYKKFWDSLFMFFDYNDIFSSTLFSNENISFYEAKRKNNYLKSDNYYKLREKIDNVKINHYSMDVKNALNLNSYDLVYLSNIISYMDIDKYKEMLKYANLSDNGLLLTYLFNSNNYSKAFDEAEFDMDKISNTKNKILIYKKY